jgi:hypothetical protein
MKALARSCRLFGDRILSEVVLPQMVSAFSRAAICHLFIAEREVWRVENTIECNYSLRQNNNA